MTIQNYKILLTIHILLNSKMNDLANLVQTMVNSLQLSLKL